LIIHQSKEGNRKIKGGRNCTNPRVEYYTFAETKRRERKKKIRGGGI
jgi:hypothetical protein